MSDKTKRCCETCLHYLRAIGQTWGDGRCRAHTFGGLPNDLPVASHGGTECRFWRPAAPEGEEGTP